MSLMTILSLLYSNSRNFVLNSNGTLPLVRVYSFFAKSSQFNNESNLYVHGCDKKGYSKWNYFRKEITPSFFPINYPFHSLGCQKIRSSWFFNTLLLFELRNNSTSIAEEVLLEAGVSLGLGTDEKISLGGWAWIASAFPNGKSESWQDSLEVW